MTKAEFKSIAKALRLAYERDGFLNTPEKMEFWYSYLEEFKAFTVQMVVNEYIKDNKFQPSVSDIYKPCEEYEHKAKREMYEIFYSAKGAYPCSKVEEGTMDAWNRITASDDWNKRVSKANNLRTRIFNFVREHELDGTINDIPTFTEYLQGIANELRS